MLKAQIARQDEKYESLESARNELDKVRELQAEQMV